MAGLFKKVRNRMTRRRYVVSTVRKEGDVFETAVFEANLFYWPRSLKHPSLALQCHDPDEATRNHETLARRILVEYPPRVFQEYEENNG